MKLVPTWSTQLGVAATILFMAVAPRAAFAEDAKPVPKQHCVSPENQQDKTKLSTKLDDCNGVLKPPKVGDKEIVAPTPETGTMPVVKPGELPQNKNP